MSIDLDVLDAGIAVITINRPEKRNALDAEHYQALSEAWTRVRDDDGPRHAALVDRVQHLQPRDAVELIDGG